MKRCFFLFCIGAAGYCLLEFFWRGYTHISMAFLGGFCLIGIYEIYKKTGTVPLVLKAFLCALFITSAELLTGLLVNCRLKLDVWDYSGMSYQFMGQISLCFSVGWFFLSLAILLIFSVLEKRKKRLDKS
ncbi:MAG: hypothetical protein IKJ55_03865 [Clostridia bacterium]|nr:hypothetical protein [Clostridia bacterium]